MILDPWDLTYVELEPLEPRWLWIIDSWLLGPNTDNLDSQT